MLETFPAADGHARSETGRVDGTLSFTPLPLSSARRDWQRTSFLCKFFNVHWNLLVGGEKTSTRMLQKLLANDAVRLLHWAGRVVSLNHKHKQRFSTCSPHNPHRTVKALGHSLWGLSWSWAIYFSFNSALQSYMLPGYPKAIFSDSRALCTLFLACVLPPLVPPDPACGSLLLILQIWD